MASSLPCVRLSCRYLPNILGSSKGENLENLVFITCQNSAAVAGTLTVLAGDR
jgi:hypothetical protein